MTEQQDNWHKLSFTKIAIGDTIIDGKKLVIPDDITAYESAHLCILMSTSSLSRGNSCYDYWEYVERVGIERLFVENDNDN